MWKSQDAYYPCGYHGIGSIHSLTHVSIHPLGYPSIHILMHVRIHSLKSYQHSLTRWSNLDSKALSIYSRLLVLVDLNMQFIGDHLCMSATIHQD